MTPITIPPALPTTPDSWVTPVSNVASDAHDSAISILDETLRWQKPKIFIYRDNEIFRTDMPVVLQTIADMHGKGESHIFPQWTPEEEIAQWWQENAHTLWDYEIFTDWTCSPKNKKNNVTGVTASPFSIDHNFLRNVRSPEIWDTGISEFEAQKCVNDHEVFHRVFVWSVKEILTVNVPEKITIVRERILDHLYYKRSWGDNSEYRDEMSFAQTIIKWLKEAWIPDTCEIKIAPSLPRNYAQIGADNTQWLITDRHNGNSDFPGWEGCLLLPANDFRLTSIQKFNLPEKVDAEKNIRRRTRDILLWKVALPQ